MVIGLVAAGCGGDDNSSSGSGGDSATKTEQPAGSGGGGGAKVSIEAIQFIPADITVKADETITFTNNEDVGHDVHKSAGPGKDFASGATGAMQNGDTFELTLDKPGMVGEIIVE